MGNTFQNQFLKAGLVDKQKAKKVKTEKRRENQKKLKNKAETINEAKNQAIQTRANQTKRDRELNKNREDALKQREISAQVKQLIELNKISWKTNHETEDIPYNFSDRGKIKKIHTSKELHAQISTGKLGIVKQEDHYEIVPAVIAEKISQRRPEHIIVLLDPSQEDDNDDLYADYKIPDDLMW